MTKIDFLRSLRDKLWGLPQNEVDERLRFYSEMLDDRMEEGLSEEAAVAAVGSVDEIAAQIIEDNAAPIEEDNAVPTVDADPVNGNSKPRRHRGWEIALLALGSPIWLSLLIAVLAVVLSLYAVMWSVIGSLWAVFVSLVACAVCGLTAGAVFAFGESALAGLAVVAAGLVCAGSSIFLFYGCKAATKGMASLAKKIVLGIKNAFVKKEVEP